MCSTATKAVFADEDCVKQSKKINAFCLLCYLIIIIMIIMIIMIIIIIIIIINIIVQDYRISFKKKLLSMQVL